MPIFFGISCHLGKNYTLELIAYGIKRFHIAMTFDINTLRTENVCRDFVNKSITFEFVFLWIYQYVHLISEISNPLPHLMPVFCQRDTMKQILVTL